MPDFLELFMKPKGHPIDSLWVCDCGIFIVWLTQLHRIFFFLKKNGAN